MGLFQVVFNRHEKFSSDANVGQEPVPGATVVAPVHQADIVHIEADSPEQAERAVYVAYNGNTSEVVATPVEPVVADEQDAEPELKADAEPVAATESVADTSPVADTAESVNVDQTEKAAVEST